MSLEIKNLSISVKIEPDGNCQESVASVKESVLRECKRLIEASVRHNQER
jgi:hypothetical protein